MAIDVSGAFDNISWKCVMSNLCKSGIENHYLIAAESLIIDRQIQIDGRTLTSERGCPQGGCASPALWRIGMNGLLNLLTQKFRRLKFTAYADDLALLISSNSRSDLEKELNEIWRAIDKWCRQAELSLNIDKTEFLLLGRRKIELKLEGKIVKLSSQIKYLGLIIDKGLTYRAHLESCPEPTTAPVTIRLRQAKLVS